MSGGTPRPEPKRKKPKRESAAVRRARNLSTGRKHT